tara:strand:- start:9534 stop:10130 length:597 start_codon:yes stop_codon:yes gene_type:complete
MIRNLLIILLFLPFGAISQVQHIEVCTENQEYLQEYWVDNPIPSVYEWIVQGGLIVSGQGTDFIIVNWLNVPYGMYNISVSVVSDVGCEGNTVTLMVDVDECSFDAVYVPNCFTVNNDGINDDWGPIFSGDWDNSAYKMYIFNRWGGMVWESHDPNETWDGRFKDKLCQDGVYVWLMYHKKMNSIELIESHGHVTLLK